MIILRDNYTKNLDLSLFCRKIDPLFISAKLDPEISISYKLVSVWLEKTELPSMKSQLKHGKGYSCC